MPAPRITVTDRNVLFSAQQRAEAIARRAGTHLPNIVEVRTALAKLLNDVGVAVNTPDGVNVNDINDIKDLRRVVGDWKDRITKAYRTS